MAENDFKTRNGLVISANNTLVVNTTSNRVGINTPLPQVSLHINSSDSVLIPAGTSAQRGFSSNGSFRYNTDLNAFEGYANNSWMIIAQAGANSSIFSSITAGTIQFNSTGYDYTLGASNSYSVFLSNTKIFSLTTASANLYNIVLSPGSIIVGNTATSNIGITTQTVSANTITLVGANTIVISAPTTVQKNGSYFLNANGSYTIVDQTASVGSNTNIEFNDSGIRAGASNHTYDKTNKLVVNWAGYKSRYYDPTNNANTYFEIFNDGNAHIESNTALWINTNTGLPVNISGNTATVSILGSGGLTVSNGDIRTARNGTAGNSGVIFLGNTGERFVYYDGLNYQMPGADLYVNSGKVLTENNFNSYSPSLTGSDASGTWPISITGSSGSLNGYTINQNLNTQNSAMFSALVVTTAGITKFYDSTNTNFGQLYFNNGTYLDSNTSLNLNNRADSGHIYIGHPSSSGSIYLSGNSATSIINLQNDVNVNRDGGNYARIIFGNTTNNALIFDGTNYSLLAGDLYVNSGKVLTENNFNSYSPSLTGSDASGTWPISITGSSATLNGYTINQNLRSTDTVTFNSIQTKQNITTCNTGNSIAFSVGSYLETRAANGANNPAVISFNRPGAYAAYFGLDIDNQFKVGGWSMGNTSYPILHSNNFNSYAPSLTGSGASGTWPISITGSSATLNGYTINQNLRTTDSVTYSGLAITNGTQGTINLGSDETTYVSKNAEGELILNAAANKYAIVKTDGSLAVSGNIWIGADGATDGPSIRLKDNDGSSRYLYHNDSKIGFLNNAGSSVLRIDDTGNIGVGTAGTTTYTYDGNINGGIWGSSLSSWLDTYKVSKAGDIMSGDLTINKSWPQTVYDYPNVRNWGMRVADNGEFQIVDYSASTNPFSVRTDGTTLSRSNLTVGSAQLNTDGNLYMPCLGDWLTNRMTVKDGTWSYVPSGVYVNSTGGRLTTGSAHKFSFLWDNAFYISVNDGPWAFIAGDPSDKNIKKNIEYIHSYGYDAIKKLKPAKFEYNFETEHNLDLPVGTRYGFIAQDIEKFEPTIVIDSTAPTKDTNVSIPLKKYDQEADKQLIAILVSAVQELQKKVETLEQRLGENNGK